MWLSLDTTKPHPARIYDYLLGGKDNFAVDRETAESAMRSWRSVRTAARENRAFLGRAVRYLVREAGIRQFLDVGTGLPAANNVHEVAQALEPECRVVYADNDPIVLAHARALLASGPEGRTAYIDADLREPEKILASRAVAETLDLSEPVALMLVAVLHFLPDEDDPAHSVSTLLDALPSGSYLVASHATLEYDEEAVSGAGRAYQGRGLAGQLRTIDELAELAFRGLDMVDPGVVPVSEWRPEGNRPRPLPAEVNANGGVGRKP
jgi:S-adenosyl methyltransferase